MKVTEKENKNSTTMGTDTDLVAVLQDLVQFLESLADVNLPNGLQNVRDNLLRRSITSLVAVGQRSTTPESYLDMNASKGKGLHLMETIDTNKVINDNQITEYMYADSSNQSKLSSCQDYYESFSTDIAMNSCANIIKHEWNGAEEELKIIYRTFTCEQTMSKATKSGPLSLKEERRLFGFQIFGGFDQFRSCFVGLIGTHLLLYSTKHDKHPSDIISIRGYSARASPNAIPRDLERCKSAFEIFSPGNSTFQFTARSPKEMEQWVAVISRAGNVPSSPVNARSTMTKSIIIDETTRSVDSVNSTCSEEQYQDVACMKDGKSYQTDIVTDSDSINGNENKVTLRNEEECTIFFSPRDELVSPPPLPARIPRRLPSLPHEQPLPESDSIDDAYDEDGIYHKIEDVKQLVSTYQNLTTISHTSNVDKDQTESKRKGKKPMKSRTKNKKISFSPGELYDDAESAEVPKLNRTENKPISMTYDDIQAIFNDTKEEIVKESRKKSFLDRVRHRKESPKKDDAKKKIKQHKMIPEKNIIPLEYEPKQELPPYDDVFGLGIDIQQCSNDDVGNYTCPPAPRLIYGKPKSIIVDDDRGNEEGFYDDVGVFQNNGDDKFRTNLSYVSTFKPSCPNDNDYSSRLAMNSLQMTKTMTNRQDEYDHYQVPRPQDPIDIRGQVEMTPPMAEDLYDDIAIIASFRARQRDCASSNSSSKDKIPSATTNVARVWNRFASGRKVKTFDSPLVDRNERLDTDETVDMTRIKLHSNEEIDGLKINKLHKLINKMELSLSKSKPISANHNISHDDCN